MEATELPKEKERVVRRTQNFQNELGALKMKLNVSLESMRKSRVMNANLWKGVDPRKLPI
jgi:hypothetical protein